MNDTQRERDRQDNMRFVARAMLMERNVITRCGTHKEVFFLLSESEDGDAEAEAIDAAVELLMAHDRTMAEFKDADEVGLAFESVLADTGGVTYCVVCNRHPVRTHKYRMSPSGMVHAAECIHCGRAAMAHVDIDEDHRITCKVLMYTYESGWKRPDLVECVVRKEAIRENP